MARATFEDILVPGLTGKLKGVDRAGEAERHRQFKAIVYAAGRVVWGKPGPVDEGEHIQSYLGARISGRKMTERYLLMHSLLPFVSCATHPHVFAGSFDYVDSPELEALFEPPFLWIGQDLFEARMLYPLRGIWIERLDKNTVKEIEGFGSPRLGEVIFNYFD